jgi:hypothetical protein
MMKINFRLLSSALAVLIGLYLTAAYLVVPAFWQRYESQPGLASLPMTTKTKQGIPGDPINVALVGSRDEVVAAMKAAGWSRPDPVSLKTSVKIAGSVALHRSYLFAPVSPLFYQGRRQDLAFEKQQGKDASQRHHVRFWKVLDQGAEGRPVWLGAATFDQSVGFSHRTGQITHHISADVDTERNFLIGELDKTLRLSILYQVSGIGPGLLARNGGGDYYYSDGELHVAVIAPDAALQSTPAKELAAPALVSIKDSLWAMITGTRGR